MSVNLIFHYADKKKHKFLLESMAKIQHILNLIQILSILKTQKTLGNDPT